MLRRRTPRQRQSQGRVARGAAKTIAAAFPKGTIGKTSVKDLGGVQVFSVDIKNDLPGAVVQVTADGTLVLTESTLP